MTETANRTAAAHARETPADIWIVDADVHVHEDPAELAEYAAPPWDVALREIAKVEERYLDLPAMSPRAPSRSCATRRGCCPGRRGPARMAGPLASSRSCRAPPT